MYKSESFIANNMTSLNEKVKAFLEKMNISFEGKYEITHVELDKTDLAFVCMIIYKIYCKE